MRRLMAAAVVAVMLGAGCAGLQTTPPAGCETAVSYRIPGFLPLGPVVIRLGLKALVVYEPAAREPLMRACELAHGAMSAGDLAGGVTYLAGVAAAYISDPQARLLALSAVEVMGLVISWAGNNPVLLTDCDREIVLSLVNNIRADAAGLR